MGLGAEWHPTPSGCDRPTCQALAYLRSASCSRQRPACQRKRCVMEAMVVDRITAHDVSVLERSQGDDDQSHQQNEKRTTPQRRGADNEVVVCRLSERWIVKSDSKQWMLCRWHKAARYPGGGFWEPVSFVASTKAILERCIRESGAVVDVAGRIALNTLPCTFRKWHQRSRQG